MASAALKESEVEWSACGEFWYDEASAQAAVDFFARYLKLTDAEWAGQPFILADWQEQDIIRPLFGWKRKDGTRRYRRAIIWVPRKNGKTELAAGVALLALLFDAEQGGQVYSIAADKDQASIVFGKAAAMVAMSPDLSKVLDCFKPSIYCAELNSSFKPLSGRPHGKHGLSASGLIGDEVHEWRDADLYTFVHQSTAARRQPLEFLISTAGLMLGYGWELWTYCKRVMAGELTDRETLIVVYAADPDDDWTSPETWKKANPNFGISPKREYLEAECAEAMSSARKENDFKRYHLNLWTEQAVRWLPMDKWGPASRRWAAPDFEARLAGRRCFGGLDLSTTSDLSAYCLWFPPDGPEWPIWIKLTRAFLPKMNLKEKVKSDQAPYDEWEKSGALFTTPGNVIDYGFIKEKIVADAARFKLVQMGADPYNAHHIVQELMDEGLPITMVRQGFLSLTTPSKELERIVLSSELDHGGHPVARWCASNAAVETDAAGNIKPTKDPRKSTGRIDTIAADVDALAVALAGMGGSVKSFWEN